MKEGNLRNMTVTPDTGKDVRDTQIVSGVAKKTRAFQASNETKEYETPAAKKGALGGENTNS